MWRKLSIVCISILFSNIFPAYSSAPENTPRLGSFSDQLDIFELRQEGLSEEVVELFLEGVTFRLHVPESYDPDHPPGVIVYISPAPKGHPREEWIESLDRHNLIWIGIDGSGNDQIVKLRIVETLASLNYVKQRYTLNPDRHYLAGVSGGGRVSSVFMNNFQNIFTGAIYMIGVNPWENHTQPDEYTQKDVRFVFLTGSKDFNRKETRQVYRQYKKLGIERIKLLDYKGMKHYWPSAERFEESIRYLDSFFNETPE